jgi:hypothetical protein
MACVQAEHISAQTFCAPARGTQRPPPWLVDGSRAPGVARHESKDHATGRGSAPRGWGDMGHTRCHRAAPVRPTRPRLYRPVAAWARCTGLDSGDPRSRNQRDTTTTLPTAQNSLCQFWNDSNQKGAVPRYWRTIVSGTILAEGVSGEGNIR